MPGARLRTFRLGDRSELLVEQLLASFAFTARVPRQEDHGIDFFCNLISAEASLLKAGPFFTVQAKSSTDAVVYEKAHELDWIMSQENPLLLCVSDRKALAMDVYSTWNLLCGVLGGWRGQRKASRIALLPGADPYAWPGVENNNDGSQEIRLGKPIVRVTDADIFGDPRLERIATVVRDWVALDRTNIVNRHAGMYWVQGPLKYETGESPYVAGQAGVAFYWNPANLAQCSANLGRVATALMLVFRAGVKEAELTQQPWSERMTTIRAVLRSHWDLLDTPVKEFLKEKNLGVAPE